MVQEQKTGTSAPQSLPTESSNGSEAVVTEPRQKLWIAEIWQEIRTILKEFLAHAIFTLLLILALSFFEYVITKSSLSAYHKSILEEIDFWGIVGALLVFVVSFIIKLFLLQVRHNRHHDE